MEASHIFLTGFMGAGKSTVGMLLARRLGMPFVDLDRLIEERTGRTIADLFERSGEPAFRRLERSAVEEVARWGGPHVVATGGGVLEDPSNLAAMERAGTVVWVYCDFERCVQRARRDGEVRPLLRVGGGDHGDEAGRRWEARRFQYARASVWVDGRLDPPSVADAVVDALSWRRALPVRAWVLPPGHVYPVVVGNGVASEPEALLRRLVDARGGLGGGVLVVADRAVAGLGRRWVEAARAGGWPGAMVEVGPGEGAKSLQTAQAAYEQAATMGLDRSGLVVGVGGGAALDLAGFVAATYMRGVDWVSVPTTLLAQVDAGLGGKTAVNLGAAKNLVGAFHHPVAVACDPEVLSTLPPREFASGMAEVIKHGLVGDPAVLDLVEQGTTRGAWQGEWLRELVSRAAVVKAVVVTEDPEELGLRSVLNFGHTVGHALESEGGFGRLLHGEAVAIGMVTALELSRALGLLQDPDAVMDRARRLLARAGLPTSAAPDPPSATRLWRRMRVDKKRRDGRPRFVLLRSPGRAVVASDGIDVALFERAWAEQHRRQGGGSR